MREWIARIADWFRRDRLERELQEELQFHQQQLERDALHAGTPAGDARNAARRRLGNVTSVAERARDRWSLPTLDRFQQDVRYALRGLRRSPGFTATAVATLALGIGANAAMFGVIDQLMFRPFAYLEDPATVHRVYLQSTHRGVESIRSGGFEYTRYLDLRRFTNAFSSYAAFAYPTLAIGTGDATREARVGAVSGSFWNFFNARPALGRFFTPAEDSTPRGAEVGVLGYAYWESEFGGDDVLGKRLDVGEMSVTIIGVAPKGFTGVLDASEPAVFIPITLYAGSRSGLEDRTRYYTHYNWGWASVMVRRKPGATIDQATAEMHEAHRRSWEAEREISPTTTPVEIARPGAVLSSLKTAAGPEPGLEARTALWLTGVAGVVLLIACANVANLVLARALRRQRETAVRLALGVSRGRLVRQALVESLMLSLLGSAMGLVVAQWGGDAIRQLLTAQDAPRDVMTDWRTLGVVTGIAVFAGVLTGVVPAFLAGRDDLAKAMKAGAREGTHHRSRARAALLVIQGALSVALLVGAGLFVRSLDNVKGMRMGYDAEQALLVTLNMRGTPLDSAQQVALRRELVARAQALPVVAHAASISSIPFWSTSSTGFHVAGIDSVARLGRFTYQTATSDFFPAMGTRVLRGRGFTDADRDGAPLVVVVSDEMAKVLWPGEEAIGQCVRVGADTMPCTTVVGVAENIVQNESQLEDTRRLHYYLPMDQYRPQRGSHLLLRVRGDVVQQRESIRKAMQGAMPGQSYVTVLSLLDPVQRARRSWELGATLFVAFGVLALAVAAIGLYGVVAYNVAQRMHELGVRVALGAQRRDILRLVLSQSARFALAGAAVGCVVALAASRWLQPLLFQQSATDPAIYLAVSVIMIVVALVAATSPALRAARTDPNEALRAE